jgi:hypothetical protein
LLRLLSWLARVSSSEPRASTGLCASSCGLLRGWIWIGQGDEQKVGWHCRGGSTLDRAQRSCCCEGKAECCACARAVMSAWQSGAVVYRSRIVVAREVVPGRWSSWV